MNNCDQGHNGKCCCNCSNQLQLVKHPMNKNFGKGPMSEMIGFACLAFQSERKAVFFAKEHGMCEMYYNQGHNKGHH